MPTDIEQSLIDPNPYQPRQDMDPVALNRLAEDLKLNGLLQPPAVRPVMGGRYQLIFGHRRAAAWRIAYGDRPLPCDVRDMDDRQMFAAAIVEAAIERGHAGIRLMPVAPEGGNGDYWRKQITGSEHVDVVLADGHTLDSIAKSLGKKAPKPAAQKADQQETREAELRHNYEHLMDAAKSTVIALLPLFRSTITLTPAVGARLLDREWYNVGQLIGSKTVEQLKKAVENGTATQPQIVDALMASILWDITDDATPSWYSGYKPTSPQKVRDVLAQFAQANKIKLPAGWDSRLTAAPSPVGRGQGEGKPAKKVSKKK